MQIALYDIRNLGLEKIGNQYLIGDSNLLDIVKEYNYEVCDFSVSSYGLLTKYDKLRDKSYEGFDLFVQNIDVFAGIHKSSDASKRSFRQAYDSIWKNFKKVCNLSDSEAKILSDFGLRLAFISANELSSNLTGSDYSLITDFYNCVLTWFVFCRSEDNFKTRGMKPYDVLRLLAVKDFSEFEKSIKDNKFK